MNRAIGSWTCDSLWQFFRKGRFELSIPFPALVRITAVRVDPKFESIKVEGYFVKEYMKDPPAAPGPPGDSCLR